MLITTLTVLWAGLTVILIGLLVYRGTLRIHENAQIFLDQHLAKEQVRLLARIERLRPWVRISGVASAVLIAIIVGLEGYAHMT
ncbi:MAG TPA: hypothetical protein VHA33_29480 [Candidatus Angelobacter sp.]|jgi:hypothetical protein|nr:hypothetical protein [Candidatus Angelobacter sp.]